MAPTVPSKRRSVRARLATKSNSQEPYAPRKALRPGSDVPDTFIDSKREKRLIKRSSFVSRIEKACQKPLKRRRPAKKLVTDLDSLRKALPNLLADGESEESLQQLREGRMRLKSLHGKKGALKKKEAVIKGEVERFNGNLARLNVVGAGAVERQSEIRAGLEEKSASFGDVEQGNEPAVDKSTLSQSTGDRSITTPSITTDARWATLKNFISATMEQNPAFLKKKGEGKNRLQ